MNRELIHAVVSMAVCAHLRNPVQVPDFLLSKEVEEICKYFERGDSFTISDVVTNPFFISAIRDEVTDDIHVVMRSRDIFGMNGWYHPLRFQKVTSSRVEFVIKGEDPGLGTNGAFEKQGAV